MAYSLKPCAHQLWICWGIVCTLSYPTALGSQAFSSSARAQDLSKPFLDGLPDKADRAPLVIPLKRQSASKSLLDVDSSVAARSGLLAHKRKSHRPHNYSFIEIFGSVREAGYYYAEFQIGTPPQDFELIVDTGSTITYVPCSDCTHCGQHTNDLFRPSNSSTFRMVGCQEKLCAGKVCTDGTCAYFRHYAENSSSRGSLVEDVLGLKNPNIQDPPARIVFGCENLESGDLYAQTADGIMGLGNADIAIHNQLMETQGLSNTFGLCFGGFNGGGSLILGDFALPASSIGSSEAIYTPLVDDPRHPTYYKVFIELMTLGTEPLTLDQVKFGIKKDQGNYIVQKWQELGYGIVLDSGTTFSYLPEPLFLIFITSFKKQVSHLRQIAGPDPNFNDLCYESSPETLDTDFPVLNIRFRPLPNATSDAVLKLYPKNYLFMHDDHNNAYCLGFFNNGYSGTLLGGITFRDILVMYELNKKRIGFMSPFDCGSLSKLSTHLDERCIAVSPGEIACSDSSPSFSNAAIDKSCDSGCQADVNIVYNQNVMSLYGHHHLLRHLKECFGLEELAVSDTGNQEHVQTIISGRIYDVFAVKMALIESFCSQRKNPRTLFSLFTETPMADTAYFSSSCKELQAGVLGMDIQICSKPRVESLRLALTAGNSSTVLMENSNSSENSSLRLRADSGAPVSVNGLGSLNLDRVIVNAVVFVGLGAAVFILVLRSQYSPADTLNRPHADSIARAGLC